MLNLPYLQKIKINKSKEDLDKFPFVLDSICNIEEIEFKKPVTFIIGENGAGKSTLIEAIAVSLRLNPEGGNRNSTFSTRNTHSELHKHMKLSKGPFYPKDWYFLRSESFYNVASLMDDMPEVISYGGKLHTQSHGESFMAVLSNKLRGNGFYIMDEPEAALSPMRQLSALVQIDKLVKLGSQFIISTHSPILMAYPDADIFQLTDKGLAKINYEETEHYMVTKDFLNLKDKMLSELLDV